MNLNSSILISDGNGRLGRLWQTLILSCWRAEMAYLPVESIIREQQSEYYRVLGPADQASDCSVFIEFMLGALAQALRAGIETASPSTMPVEMTVQVPGETPLAIIRALQKNPELTIPMLAAQLGLSSRTIERHLRLPTKTVKPIMVRQAHHERLNLRPFRLSR